MDVKAPDKLKPVYGIWMLMLCVCQVHDAVCFTFLKMDSLCASYVCDCTYCLEKILGFEQLC